MIPAVLITCLAATCYLTGRLHEGTRRGGTIDLTTQLHNRDRAITHLKHDRAVHPALRDGAPWRWN